MTRALIDPDDFFVAATDAAEAIAVMVRTLGVPEADVLRTQLAVFAALHGYVCAEVTGFFPRARRSSRGSSTRWSRARSPRRSAPPDERLLRIDDRSRVRTLTLDRPEALNAFNEALYDATTEAPARRGRRPARRGGGAHRRGPGVLRGHRPARDGAGVDPTGLEAGKHGFLGLIDALVEFPKPLDLAVNGLGLGIGATILGFADLAFMSTEARLKCPFTSLAVAPEAASSLPVPLLVGRQNATWALCRRVGRRRRGERDGPGLAGLRARGPAARDAAPRRGARRPADLVAGRREAHDDRALASRVAGPRERENAAFAELMGGPANTEALTAFAERREPDFTTLPPGW